MIAEDSFFFSPKVSHIPPAQAGTAYLYLLNHVYDFILVPVVDGPVC